MAEETAYDVARRYYQGKLTRAEMVNTLVNWDYPPEHDPQGDDTPAPNDPRCFSETVGRAYDNGLLSDADYDEVLDRWLDLNE